MIDIEAMRCKVRLGEYSIRPDAVQHAFKESFSQDDMEHVVLHGRVVEEYPERGRCLIGGFITLGQETRTPLHMVCEHSDPEDVVDFVTAYIPDKEWWLDPWTRRKWKRK